MPRQIFSFFLYTLLQIWIFNHFVVFNGLAACYVYVGFLLLLPYETDKILLLFLGFQTGILIDIFSNTLGIHTAACVLVAYLRPYVIQLITPRGGYEENMELSLHNMGFEWFLRYMLLLTFVHHFVLFFIEAAQFSNFFYTLLKIILSTLFSSLLMILFQFLFYTKRR
jgi:hypothetical protein